jgi:hypothetical protein
MTHRESFERLGGYDGRLHGWGWEDQDMIARLTLGEGLRRVQSGHVRHISHADEARIRYYPPVKDRWESRDRMFRQALANYDCGHFAGTLAADVIELSRVCQATQHMPHRLPGRWRALLPQRGASQFAHRYLGRTDEPGMRRNGNILNAITPVRACHQ